MPVSPASSHTPALPDAGDGRLCTPPFVLLDTHAYLTNRENATKAAALMRTGQAIAVSFFPVEPPGVSYFGVHFPGLKEDKFHTDPWAVHSTQDDVLLLGVSLPPDSHDVKIDYFVYKAGRHPTLQLLHGLDFHLCKHLVWPSIAFVPRGDDGDNFVVTAVGYTVTSGQYELFLFDSEPGTSTVRVLELAMSSPAPTHIRPTKVIMLGGGEVGFVDLWSGIMVCDVLSEDPWLRFIPLPKLLPCNNANYDDGYPRRYRDVIFAADGLIKCVEVEHRWRRIVHEIPDVSEAEVLDDSEFRFGPEEREYTYEYLGWRIITWSRRISSDSWHRGCIVHDDEILVSNPSHGVFFPELVDDNARKELVTGYPTMSVAGGDVVYLMCKVKEIDKKGWAVAIDMMNKTVECVAPFSNERSKRFYLNCISCSLFKYLNTSA